MHLESTITDQDGLDAWCPPRLSMDESPLRRPENSGWTWNDDGAFCAEFRTALTGLEPARLLTLVRLWLDEADRGQHEPSPRQVGHVLAVLLSREDRTHPAVAEAVQLTRESQAQSH